jgi:hypothetical protein
VPMKNASRAEVPTLGVANQFFNHLPG